MADKILSQRIDITTTAGGAATPTSQHFNGYFIGFELVLGTATAADVTIADAAGVTLYTKTGLNASALHAVRVNAVNGSGTAITNSFVGQPVVGPLTITIANGGATKTLSIILHIER